MGICALHSVTKVFSNKTCILSLNQIDDPLYSFTKQFPKVKDECPSPIQCITTSNVSTGRRLLGRTTSTTSSGFGISPSDVRLKTGITPTGHHIAGLPKYTWRWNGVAKALHLDNYPAVGVMAQEAQAMHPQAVSTGADGYLRVDYSMLSAL